MSMYISEAEGLEFLKTVQVLLASEFKRLTPHCPECGTRMKECFAEASDKPFWGCPRFPNCKGFRGMRRSARWRNRVKGWRARVDAWLKQEGPTP